MSHSDWRSIEARGWLRARGRRAARMVAGAVGALVELVDAWSLKVERFLGVPTGRLSVGVLRLYRRGADRVRAARSRLLSGIPGALPAIALLRRSAHAFSAQVRATVARRPWILGIALAALMLAALHALDAILSNPPSIRLLYILPIWLATRLSGPWAGSVAVVAVAALLADLESAGPYAATPQANAVIRVLSLALIMLAICHVETRLQAIQAQARLDPLTGVLNRTELQKRITYALDSMRRHQGTVSVAVVDCDRFKDVNDTFGHAFGDYVLRVLARRLAHATRQGGVVGRIGGDEFVVLFEGLGYDAARHFMETAEESFSRHMTSLGCSATLSYGLAVAGPETATMERLIEAADERMYAKKRQAVCVGGGLEARGEPISRRDEQPRLI